MADIKISEDTLTTSISGAEFIPIVQNLTNYRITPDNLLASRVTSVYIGAQLTNHLSTYIHSTYITSLIPTNIMSVHESIYDHDNIHVRLHDFDSLSDHNPITGSQDNFVSLTAGGYLQDTGVSDDTYVRVDGANPVEAYIDFTETADDTTPAADVIRIRAMDFKGFTFLESIDATGMVRKLVRDSVYVVKADVDITIGQLVYATGSSRNVPTVDLAKSDSIDTMPAIGIAIEEITSGTFGRVMQVGLMEHFNTDAFAEGDVLYVSADIAGAMTTTPPTYPNIRQEIGTVLVKGVGEGAMQIVARTMLYEPIIDHAGLLNLEEGDPHTQYVLESGYTAKGVILVGTAAGTFVALSVDANGTVLTADSGEASGVKWAASSSGVTELASLSDVTITPATLDIILYDGSTWVNTTLNDPGGITELRSLSDVVIATPATVDTLIFDGSTWINTQFSATGSGFTKLASMSDVTIISPATLDILMHDGSTWINTDCTYTHSLAGLDDVTVSAPATLDTMVYNGSIWINQSALFNEIANVRMTMVGSNMIQLTGIGGTNGLFYINGEIANLSTTIRTLDNLSTMILDDGTDSTSPTVAATTLFVYASNSLVTSMPNQLRTSIYSPNANKYLGTTGDAKNWRLAGWVYLVTASGTPFYYDENSALFAISKWNPKQKYGFISNTTSHSYTTASWRTWLNNIALTRIEFIQHEDFLNLHTMMQVYYYGTGSSGANANSVGYDSTSVPDDTTTIYFRNGTNDDNRFRTGSSGIQLMTPGYHYVNVLQLGSANSLLYNACYLTINIWG